MKYIITVAILVFAFAGCKDDEQPEPDKAVWQEISHFQGRDKILLNSMATEEALYIYKVNGLTMITDPNNTGEFSYIDWTGTGHTDISHKPMMTHDFILARTFEEAIVLDYPVGRFNKTFRFDLKEFDEGINRLDINTYWFGEYIKSNNNKQLLIRVDQAQKGITYLLATMHMPHSWHIDSVELKIIDFEQFQGRFNIQFASAIDEYFFIGNSRMFRVDTDGNTLKVSEDKMLRCPFKYSFDGEMSEVYMGISQNDYVIISYDNGLTWNNFTAAPKEGLNRYHYINIDGNILGYHSRYGIIHLDIQEDLVKINQIDTEGITNEITSLSKFKNDFVVTTFSGAFKKSASDFYTYRE